MYSIQCSVFHNIDSITHATRLSTVDAGRRGEHHGDVTRTTGRRVHDGGSHRGVGQVGDHGAAATAHSIRRTLTLHHAGATGDGTAVLHLLLGDLALGEETQQLANSGFGLLT